MRLAGTGIWSGELRYGEAGEKRDAAAELEELGYSALWIPDTGGDVFGALPDLADATASVVVATGVLNLWMHAADEVAAGFTALEGDQPGRTFLGIGVSHSLVVEQTTRASTTSRSRSCVATSTSSMRCRRACRPTVGCSVRLGRRCWSWLATAPAVPTRTSSRRSSPSGTRGPR